MCRIINIHSALELPSVRYCYVCEPSPENAIQQFHETFGVDPETAYVFRKNNGRVNVYISVNEDLIDIYRVKHHGHT